MSNVLQPRGPLPARVYWTRRLLVLAVCFAVVAVIGLAVAAGGDSGSAGGSGPPPGGLTEAADTPTGTGRGSAEKPAESAAEPDRAASQQGGDQADSSKGAPSGGKSGDKGDDGGADSRPDRGRSGDAGEQSPPAPLPAPSGACDPAEVSVSIEVSDAPAGTPNTATLRFASRTDPACTIGLTPESLEIQVTSGSDVIWSSTDCPARLAAKQVVARPEPPATYAFTWSGHRSTQSCGGLGEPAAPGGYHLQAALIGGEPAQAYFDVT